MLIVWAPAKGVLSGLQSMARRGRMVMAIVTVWMVVTVPVLMFVTVRSGA
jgi:hypothetical protein